jgi:hypothetical protein
MVPSYVWQESYSAAMLELDPDKLQHRIATAQETIAKRLEELKNDGAQSGDERLALSDAQQALRALARTIGPPRPRGIS